MDRFFLFQRLRNNFRFSLKQLFTQMKFKKITFLQFILFILISFAGTTQNFNRAYLSMGYGFKRHFNYGVSFHFLDHFTSNLSFEGTRIPDGPIYHPTRGLFSREQLKDTYTYYNLNLGVTTKTLDAANFSLTCGPSLLMYTDYYNINLQYNDDYTSSVDYDKIYGKSLGFNFRVDLSISLGKGIGLNLYVQENINSIRNEFCAVGGINIGLVRDREQ